MSHLVARESWGAVDLDEHLGRVFVQQTWHYHWMEQGGATPWTVEEKRKFHQELDHQIWGMWSNRLRLRIIGMTVLARRFATKGLPINFDIRWVRAGGNWQVNAHKLPAGTPMANAYRPNVTFGMHIINMYTPALAPYRTRNAAGVRRTGFRSTPHEFGHTMQNPDEYEAGSVNLNDTESLMNVGREVRTRHLALVIGTLNRLVPTCKFSL